MQNNKYKSKNNVKLICLTFVHVNVKSINQIALVKTKQITELN
jgi:hypothetical protein